MYKDEYKDEDHDHKHNHFLNEYFSIVATIRTLPRVQWSSVCGIFTESAPRPIQSMSPDVCWFVICLSPPMGPGTAWTGAFWLKSI